MSAIAAASTDEDKRDGPCVRGQGSRGLDIVNWRNSTETLHYEFDVFHGEQSSQQEVYLSSVRPVLPHVLCGQNASVFAYGPTGAGKTHTMLGSAEQPGVIPRAVRDLFQLVREQRAQPENQDWEYSIGMSYLEIYNEKVLDLLERGEQDLPIREDREHNILIPGLSLRPLDSFSDFDALFLPASQRRTTASTSLNERSSRSHAVLLLKVVKSQLCAPFRQLTGKLYLIDLAGSEDNRRTGNQGLRLKESGAINRSLFTLSKVVDALNHGLARVPYRDSKLTRLLQDSLGGSAHSVMITNIAPEYQYYFDTLTALNFAAKSKQIVNKPFIRETVRAAVPAPKRPREEQGTAVAPPPQSKRARQGQSEGQEAGPETAQTHSPSDPSVLQRLLALEKMLMGTPERQRLTLLKTVAQSRKEIQELREKQKELEEKALLAQTLTVSGQTDEQQPPVASSSLVARHPGVGTASLFRRDLPPLHRKTSTAARPRKQQAVVPPLQVSQVQPLQQCAVLCKQNTAVSKKKGSEVSLCRFISLSLSLSQAGAGQGGENSPVGDWETQLDAALLQKSRLHILQVLNTGDLRLLKGLQQIGDKKAKLILGWREIHGPFAQVEDLQKIEGISAKRFTSFIKVS
ncbi:KIF22 protein, partial [Amia calva]|nr:KIF22 protein [Amia calva]